jgi:hypothetical protein
MATQKTAEELLRDYTDSIQQWLLVRVARDYEKADELFKARVATYRTMKKLEPKLTSMVNLMESKENDYVRMCTAHWLLDQYEDRSLKVLDEIAGKHQSLTQQAGKIAREWREQKEKLTN